MIRSRFRPPFPRINRNSPLANGLVFAGLGGGASTLKMVDASGYGNDGTLTNMDPATDWVWATELGRWAINDTTTNGRIVVPIALAENLVAGIGGWFKPTSVTTSQYVTNSSVNNNYHIRVGYQSGSWNFVHDGAYPTGTAADTQMPATAGVWQHVYYESDGSRVRGFKNGVKLIDVAAALTPSAVTSVWFGAYDHTVVAASYIGGMSDLLIASGSIEPFAATLADPSNVMLEVGGVPLILPPRRVSFPAAVAEPSGFKPYWARNVNTLIGGGVS